LSSDDEEYLTTNNVAERTPARCDRAAVILSGPRLYLNSPPEAPNHWVQINPTLNDSHCHQMEIRSTFWMLEITDCWWQQEEPHSKYVHHSDAVQYIFSITPHSVPADASFLFEPEVIGGRHIITTGETIDE
jgi:hypothetical protein